MSDDLIDAAKIGDMQAISELVKCFTPYVASACLKLVEKFQFDRSMAADLRQSILGSLVAGFKEGRWPNLADREDFRKLLSTIIHHKGVDRFRKETASGRTIGDDPVFDLLESNSWPPEKTAAIQEAWDLIMGPFEPRDRAIAELLLADRTLSEILEDLRPHFEGVTRHRVDRVRERLYRRLENEAAKHN